MIEIEVPLLSPTNNKLLLMHWGKKRRLREQWLKFISASCLSQGIAIKPFLFARVEFLRISIRLPDYDNMVGGFKFILDCLTLPRAHGGLARNNYGLGFLIDDSPEYCECHYKAIKCNRIGGQKTIIRIDGRE